MDGKSAQLIKNSFDEYINPGCDQSLLSNSDQYNPKVVESMGSNQETNIPFEWFLVKWGYLLPTPKGSLSDSVTVHPMIIRHNKYEILIFIII
tara:strand:- start:238 stop:516 length:279 start_codon:yes stop_codon:yes gene_type:complete